MAGNTVSICVYATTLYTARSLQIMIYIRSGTVATFRTFCTWEFRDFSVGLAEDSVALGYDPASVGSLILELRKKILSYNVL